MARIGRSNSTPSTGGKVVNLNNYRVKNRASNLFQAITFILALTALLKAFNLI